MKRTDLPIVSNPLETRDDVQKAVDQLCEPLKPHFSEGSALVRLGDSGANYDERRTRMEAFARPLWGLVPMMAGGKETDLWDRYIEGIKNGTNPDHPEYWGDLGDYDQLAVEMPPIALAMATIPEKIWDPLNESEKANLVKWLDQINHNTVSDCNWVFFVVLVNVALKKVGAKYNAAKLEESLIRIDDFYNGDGWYSDGYRREQIDYYIPFALHYYSLIYAGLMEDEDPDRCKVYKDRASKFAKDFIYWFAADGSALPFGRSLTYRFAQTAFWGALAFADVEGLEWGVVKGVFLRNLRWWFTQPIFTTDGLLSIGYSYPNLLMSETYNAAGSPYWSFKAFLPLAVDSNHPFWTAKEKPLPELNEVETQPHPHMVICRDKKGSHAYALTAGQWMAKIDPMHQDAKYSKFAYSTVFGFSVPRQSYGLTEGAYDSMLALSEGDGFYRTRRKCEYYEVKDNTVFSIWRPWSDVQIKTWLVGLGLWHLRIHRIEADRYLETEEGGFAIGIDHDLKEPGGFARPEDTAVAAVYPWGISGIVNLYGDRKSNLVATKANTNLINPKTTIPTLSGKMGKGTHWFASAVYGGIDPADYDTAWQQRPILKLEGSKIRIYDSGNKKLLFETEMV